ncbi:uncharacterized protein LOC142980672 [Anticarsia gemmatalis]|uniref:uncharacterized protein LOC142980672 n=1 Tax=Anticarsia gemmatalis TaxID=129554 RepID=UPI003F776BAB
MTLLLLFLLFSLEVYLVEGFVTKVYGATQLWRAEDVTSGEILEDFNDRAHRTEDIWKKNDDIYFLVNMNEAAAWHELLQQHKIRYHVLIENVVGGIDDDYLKLFQNPFPVMG